MIQPTIEVDTRDLHAAITELMKNEKKTLSQIINKKLLFCVRKALQLTIKASRQRIIGLFDNPVTAGKLINTNRAKQGLPGLEGKPMSDSIKKERGKRLRAVNFVRSQWKWAIRAMAPYMGITAPNIKGSQKGGAKVAPPTGFFGGEAYAKAWNEVKGGKVPSARVQQILLKGAQAAINAEAKSTWEHAAQKALDKGALDIFNRHR